MKILHLWNGIAPDRRALLLQIARYGVVGFGVTLAQAAVYWSLATLLHWHGQIANFLGYLVAVASGYVLHGKVTFKDSEAAQGTAGHAARGFRFVLVSLLSLALNALWVWLCVSWRHWPTWTPIPAMLFVTPAVVFVLNRQWVFR
jgi:putative flippase GtrA